MTIGVAKYCMEINCGKVTYQSALGPWFCSKHTRGIKAVSNKVYIVGSLRNPVIREVANALRVAGFNVFDDWHGCGPDADDQWKTYEKDRGRGYAEALRGKLAKHAFEFDKSNLDEADAVVLVLPAGKSGHLELGYAAGKGKRTYILLEPDRDEDRWDLMYLFATAVVTDVTELLEKMND